MKNKNGVTITNSRYAGHLVVDNARCNCGFILIVAPRKINAELAIKHNESNPVVCCTDMAHNCYQFSELKPGKQGDV